MIQIEHGIFGELSCDYGWKRDIRIRLFGYERILTLIIDGDDDAEFEEAQINAYNNFFRDKDILLRRAEDEILKYYLEVYIEYRKRLGNQFADIMAPILFTKEEVGKIVEPKQLLFPMVFDEDIRQVGLLLECTWEPEHGLAVKFENEEVIEVGYQDIVL